jgi:hypothetical protein
LEQSVEFLKAASRELQATDVQFFTKPRIDKLAKKYDSFVSLISHPETLSESAYDTQSNDDSFSTTGNDFKKSETGVTKRAIIDYAIKKGGFN